MDTTSNAFKVVHERPSRFLQRVGSLLRRLGESFDTSTYSVISSTKFSHPADGEKDVLPKRRKKKSYITNMEVDPFCERSGHIRYRTGYREQAKRPNDLDFSACH